MARTEQPSQGRAGAALAQFFHHRWALPVVAELHRSRGAKFVTLVNRLGVGRDSLRRTLDALAEGRLAVRNPGYGHPMRPEYVLTHEGAAIGADCGALMKALVHAEVVHIGLRKWSMPVVHALDRGASRFSELEAALPGSTPRALASTLRGLTEVDIVRRALRDAYPPTTAYDLSELTASMVDPLRSVAAGLTDGLP